MQEISAETDESLKTLLSPAQYDAFKEQDGAGRFGPMGPGMGGGGGRGR